MEIVDILDALLLTLDLPFYDSMPVFPNGEAPELFIVYSFYSGSCIFADGVEKIRIYYVTFDIFSRHRSALRTAFNSLRSLLRNTDEFCTDSDAYNGTVDFPGFFRITQETKYYLKISN